MNAPPAVRLWLALAVVAAVVQQALTVYTSHGPAPYVFWGGLSAFLLFRVYRRGPLARFVTLVFAGFGTVLYVFQVGDGVRQIGLALAYGAEAAAMLAPPVRRWAAPRAKGEDQAAQG
jgi:hypothetical protein